VGYIIDNTPKSGLYISPGIILEVENLSFYSNYSGEVT
jgi:hypothetical protein